MDFYQIKLLHFQKQLYLYLKIKRDECLDLINNSILSYSPILAPVELFFRMTKNRIRAFNQIMIVWFNNLEGRIKIFNALWSWIKIWINDMCIQFIKI